MAPSRLRVLTLNIWNRSGPWDERLVLLKKGLAAVDADVVGLQEVIAFGGRTLADDMREGLAYEAAFGLAHDLGGGAHFGNAILSRWPILRTEVFALPNAGTAESRSLLLAEIDAPFGKLPFFCTHLNWKFHEGAVREAQVARIADIVKAEAPLSGLPPVLVGDFNAQPEATEIRFLKGLHALEGKSTFFADCYEQVGAPPGFTFDARNNPFAAPTHEYPRRIDYVFVRGPDKNARGLPLSARVVFDEVVGGVCASDHYGVVAEMSM
ncbi:MAG TPA: endonuclease/exonuclease/phosphatase family protein [Minicystis sp.]|nr:endonuclease/exonuclease/phosphatase family protein [Minicystis sp.]